MANIRFPGLASGMDTNAIVQALTNIEKQPIVKLQNQKAQLENKKKSVSEISTLLSDLKRLAEKMDSLDEIISFKATSSDSSKVSVTAGSGMLRGVHTVKVNALASSQRTYSQGFASSSQTGLLGEGTLTVAVGIEDPITVTVDSSSTLESVATALNESGASLQASVVHDGTSYFLNIVGTETGSSNTISFTESGTLFDLSNPSRTVQEATDAEALVDGLLIRRSGNVFSDVIAGVSFTALEVSAQTTTLTLEEDLEGTKSKITSFIDAYNKVQKKISDQSSLFLGDSSIRRLKSTMNRVATSSASALLEGYDSLSTLGIRTQSDGTLSMDGNAFNKAASAGLSKVLKMWTEDTSSSRKGIAKAMQEMVQSYVVSGTGDLSLKIESYSSQARKIDQNIERLTRRVDAFETRMLARFADLERTMNASLATGSYLDSSILSKG
jgi:flagellar hook-associated protein 2